MLSQVILSPLSLSLSHFLLSRLNYKSSMLVLRTLIHHSLVGHSFHCLNCRVECCLEGVRSIKLPKKDESKWKSFARYAPLED